jgi:hypothetical protein
MFLKDNVTRESFSNGGQNNNDVASGWEGPRCIMDMQSALAYFADVMAMLWAPVLNRVLILYEYRLTYESNARERCRLIKEFCDAILRESAEPLVIIQAAEARIPVFCGFPNGNIVAGTYSA